MTDRTSKRIEQTALPAQQRLPEIKAALAEADKIYMDFTQKSETETQNIEQHLKPVIEMSKAFLELTDMLATGNRAHDAILRSSITDLLQRRRAAYLEETATVMKQIAPNVPQHIRDSYHLNDIDRTFQAYNNLPTAEIVISLNELKDTAKSYHIPLKESVLSRQLAKIAQDAATKEVDYKLPQGSVQTFLELDNSRFFAFTAKTATMPGKDTLVNLLDREVFNSKLATRICAETDSSFRPTILTELTDVSLTPGRKLH